MSAEPKQVSNTTDDVIKMLSMFLGEDVTGYAPWAIAILLHDEVSIQAVRRMEASRPLIILPETAKKPDL